MAFFSYPRLPSSLLLCILLVACCVPSSSSQASVHHHTAPNDGLQEGMVLPRRVAAEVHRPSRKVSTSVNITFVLAADSTHRKDPKNGFEYYTGGWNIKNESYWSSVLFSAAPLYAASLGWFVGFGLVMLIIGCCCCCCPCGSRSYSRVLLVLSLILLIIFACVAVIGSAILYKGQEQFHDSVSEAFDYVLGEANTTVGKLRSFAGSLDAAKRIGVDQMAMPTIDQKQIDALESKINSAANLLAEKTSGSADDIRNTLDKVTLALDVVAAVMLALTFLGLVFSLCGVQCIVSFLVFMGWLLVTATLILGAVFLLLHNVMGDTCVAMDEWAKHPKEHTALDAIIPCADVATGNESFYKAKDYTSKLVNMVNTVISNVSNGNFPPILAPLYYNQSGPRMPTLCNPYTPDLKNRTCANGEVSFKDAPKVWGEYMCRTKTTSGGSEICVTVGRITPKIYKQMTAAVNVSQGLHDNGPFLTKLLDCSYVREAFTSISMEYCPGMVIYSEWVYVGLVMVSAAVSLSIFFWMVHAKERRNRSYSRHLLSRSALPPMPLHARKP